MTDAHDHDHDHGHDHEHEHHHEVSYADAVTIFRADKDKFFKGSAGSPIPAAARDAFTGLPYYPVDERMVVDDLVLGPYTGSQPVEFEFATSSGKLKPARRVGMFEFAIDGAACTLTAYRLAGDPSDQLFVPFLDATSGTETYGAGRYLELEAQDDGTWSLDFNLAYHPSCVYGPEFSCPIPPAENRLPVRIEAGERLDSAHG